MEKSYWDRFYSNPDENITGGSHFAQFIGNRIMEKSKILDLGCGNARDSIYLSSKGHEVTAVDTSISTQKIGSLKTVNGDVIDFLKTTTSKYDIIYLRWFLHALPIQIQHDVIELASNVLSSNGQICIENRSINDDILIKNSIYSEEDGSYTTSHKRWPTAIEDLEKMLKNNNMKIELSEVSRGFSPSGSRDYNKDPMLNRVIARK